MQSGRSSGTIVNLYVADQHDPKARADPLFSGTRHLTPCRESPRREQPVIHCSHHMAAVPEQVVRSRVKR